MRQRAGIKNCNKKDRTLQKVRSFSLVFLASNLSCPTTEYIVLPITIAPM